MKETKKVKGKITTYRALSKMSIALTDTYGHPDRVQFADEFNTFSTFNNDYKRQIENTRYFKTGQIVVMAESPIEYEIEVEVEDEPTDEEQTGSVETGKEETKEQVVDKPKAGDVDPMENREFPEVTTVQEGAELLFREFNVPKSATRKKDNLLKEASAIRVLFPNLK